MVKALGIEGRFSRVLAAAILLLIGSGWFYWAPWETTSPSGRATHSQAASATWREQAKLGNYSAAADQLRSMEGAEAKADLGRILNLQGRFHETIIELTATLEAEDTPEAAERARLLDALGRAYALGGWLDKSEEVYSDWLRSAGQHDLDPRFIGIFCRMACVKGLNRRGYDFAHRYLLRASRAFTDGPHSRMIRSGIAWVLDRDGAWDGARKLYREPFGDRGDLAMAVDRALLANESSDCTIHEHDLRIQPVLVQYGQSGIEASGNIDIGRGGTITTVPYQIAVTGFDPLVPNVKVMAADGPADSELMQAAQLAVEMIGTRMIDAEWLGVLQPSPSYRLVEE